ncbi:MULTISPECIES: MFS transporter [Arthrobacter]|uniref:MFS transporter n=2 Tax=Arthrobacter TaxID=1663 RepID=A0ABU9KI16_9MICC|nr:MFS transporter [Arthrobacter sp. YJM1]MDP5226516.1 MFS transporter [Arthrobacter sp. YJM1]
MTKTPTTAAARSAHATTHGQPAWLLLLAIIGIGLTMRGPFIGVAPLAPVLRGEVGLSDLQFGILTGIPVLCFAAFSPPASWLARRVGAEVAVTCTVAGVAVGAVIRSIGPEWALFAGTAIIGAAITIGNIVMPLIVRRDFPVERQSLTMGVYSGTLNFSAFLASVATAPLAQWLGWQLALGLSTLLAVLVLAFWVWIMKPVVALRSPRSGSGPATAQDKAARKESARLKGGTLTATIALVIGFAGQASSYFGITAWLPSYLHDTIGLAATEAGAGSSIFQVMGLVGAIGTPLLVRWLGGTRTTLVLGVLWVTVPLGLLLLPQLWWLWAFTGGFAQGGGFTVILSAIIKAGSNQAQTARISALVQGIAYVFAGIAPSVIGSIHVAAASWQIALLVPLMTTAAFLVCTTWGVTLSGRLAEARKRP